MLIKFNSASKLRLSWTLLFILDLIWVSILYFQTVPTRDLSPQACFTLIKSNSKQYYQWSSKKDYPPFQSGQWRWNKTPPFQLSYPTITKHKIDKLYIHQLSQGVPPKERDVAIVYDDWNQRTQLTNPLKPISQQQLSTVLFIDQSATMNNPWQNSKNSAYQISLASLQKKRLEQAENWQVTTFGSNWKHHGTWFANRDFPLQNLGRPRGKTKWNEALSEWLKTKPDVSRIILISDGKIEERNLTRLKQSLSEIKSLGHQVCVLSPTLERLKGWEQLYTNYLAQANWPSTKEQKTSDKVISDLPIASNWNNVTNALPGSKHLPLIWSNRGHLLLSMEIQEDRTLYHLAGQPTKLIESLIKKIQQEQQNTIVLETYPKHLILDLQNENWAPMSSFSRGEELFIWPSQAGIYKLNTQSNEFQLSHPNFGSITISDSLDFQNTVFQQEEIELTEPLKHSKLGAGINALLAMAHLALIAFTTVCFKTKFQHE